MTFLLDVSALIALIDPMHIAHDAVHRWFKDIGSRSWATCPLTENGAIRIASNSKYLHSPGPPASIARIVSDLRLHPGHHFWPDDISLAEAEYVDTSRILTSAKVTDTYLLALAKHHRGILATLDRKLSVDAVANGKASLHIIDAKLQ